MAHQRCSDLVRQFGRPRAGASGHPFLSFSAGDVEIIAADTLTTALGQLEGREYRWFRQTISEAVRNVSLEEECSVFDVLNVLRSLEYTEISDGFLLQADRDVWEQKVRLTRARPSPAAPAAAAMVRGPVWRRGRPKAKAAPAAAAAPASLASPTPTRRRHVPVKVHEKLKSQYLNARRDLNSARKKVEYWKRKARGTVLLNAVAECKSYSIFVSS